MGWTCNSCKLDASRVNALDVYVLFQEGPFEVRIRSIVAVTDVHPTSVPVVVMQSDDDISRFLKATVASGAYLYDKSYLELCIATYNSSLNTVMVANGPSNSIKGVACAGLSGAGEGTKSDRAWLLRDTIDAILADLSGTARGNRQSWLPDQNSAAVALDACAVPPSKPSFEFTDSSISPPEMRESSSPGSSVDIDPIKNFDGPFSGMGITGHNDLGFSIVDNPKVCAQKCRNDARCQSFDYGARQAVIGECWLSTGTRKSVGADYTSWPLYDYYELQKESDALDKESISKNNAPSCQDSCHAKK